MKHKEVKLVLTSGAFVLIILHIIWPSLKIDSITFGLVILASLPWLADIVQSAEIPGGWRIKFRNIEAQQQRQQDEISILKFLVSKLVTADELMHLRKFASDEPFPFVEDETTDFFEDELRRLRAFGLITGHPNKGIRSLRREKGDVKDHFSITPHGIEYLSILDEILPQAAPSNDLSD